VFAFDAMVLVSLGINSGGGTITYQADSAYFMSLAKKIRKSPPAWFGYWQSVQGYDLLKVQSLMESFDTQQALLSQFLTFNPDTLEVDCEFGDVDDQLESMEADLGIDQG
jgi:hypothetical protein